MTHIGNASMLSTNNAGEGQAAVRVDGKSYVAPSLLINYGYFL